MWSRTGLRRSLLPLALAVALTPLAPGRVRAQSVSGAIVLPEGRSTVGASFTVNGFARDQRASSGTGIDEVQVVATPVGGGAAILVVGTVRQFGATGGYTLTANGLTPGVDYTLAASAHSTVDNAMHPAGTATPIAGASAGTADITRLSATTSGPAATVGVGNVAYDDKHDVLLHVWNGVRDAITARFIRLDGTPAGEPFDILPEGFASSGNAVVTYSMGAPDDVFFIVFSGTTVDAGSVVIGQFFRYSGVGPTGGGPIGQPVPISSAGATRGATDVAYNPVRRQFFVSWFENQRLLGRVLGADGVPVTAPIVFAENRSGGARVDFDWGRTRYCVVFETVTVVRSTNFNEVTAVIVDGVTGQPDASRRLANTFQTAAATVRYVPASGTCLAAVDTWNIETRWVETVGNLSDWNTHYVDRPYFRPELAHDPVSTRGLLVARNVRRAEAEWVILDKSGRALSTPFALVPGVSFVSGLIPTRDRRFAFSYVRDGVATLEQIALTGDGPSGPRFSNVVGILDAPSKTTLPGTFRILGWAIDFGATSGTGIDAIHAWAFPKSGAPPVFLGAPQTFVARSDLAARFGTRFTNAGFDLAVSGLPVGEYTLAVYPHSAITGAFAAPQTMSITVAASNPLMSLDLPANGILVPRQFDVGGWAIDLTADAGAGVDVVHVWAFPLDGSAAVFLGATAVNRARPDVGAAFGAQFSNAGFRLTTPVLAEGRYRIVTYAHSTVAGSFNQSRAVEVRVTEPHQLVASDFDGDGRSDLAVYRPTKGTWYIAYAATNFTSGTEVRFGGATDVPVAADYDADGRTDMALFRPSTREWLLRRSDGSVRVVHWGEPGDIPVPADYDGDFKTDVAVYRPSTGEWFIVESRTDTSRVITLGGVATDFPSPADYDGDGTADVAVFRPPTGEWRLLTGPNASQREIQWGLSADVPIPSGYDGDRVTDIAVFRPSTGVWYVLYASGDFGRTSREFQWGLDGDMPVPADYDGDGISDLAVWRPANGVWYILKSSTNYTTWEWYQWGLEGDVPVSGRRSD